MRQNFRYANVMSTLAVFMVLGGGAFAASQIGSDDIEKNAVLSKHVDNDQLKSKDLKDNKAVKSQDVKDGALTGTDLLDGSVGLADLGADSVDSSKVLNGSLAEGDLTAEEQFKVVGTAGQPTFNNGGQGDCTWFDASTVVFPGTFPVGFRKDRFGTVHMSGIAAATENAGAGDEECGATLPEPDDTLEDNVAFILPAGYRPERAIVFVAGSTVVIVGDDPVVLAGVINLPAGAVFSTDPTFGIPFDQISFQAAEQNNLARSPVRGQSGSSPAAGDELPSLLGLGE